MANRSYNDLAQGRQEQVRRLARKAVRDGIVAIATERLITQIVEVCAEHEAASVAAVWAKCEAKVTDTIRERTDARTDFAEASTQRDTLKNIVNVMQKEIAALRARVAELEAALNGVASLRVDRDNGLQELLAKARRIALDALALSRQDSL